MKRTQSEDGGAAGSPDRSQRLAGQVRRGDASTRGDSPVRLVLSTLHSGGHVLPIDTPFALTPAPASSDDPAWSSYWQVFVDTYEADLLTFAHAFFSRRGRGPRAPELAKDAVQSFLAALMAQGWLARREDIRYPRAYLRKLLTRHIQSTHRRLAALKRGGGLRRIAFESHRLVAPETAATDGDDASEWLVAAINGAIRQMEKQKRGIYVAIIRDMIHRAAGGRTSPDLPSRLDIDPKQLPLRKCRARRAFLRELKRAVRRLTPDWETARARCRWLARQALGQPAPLRLS
jgi:hypothetical protein